MMKGKRETVEEIELPHQELNTKKKKTTNIVKILKTYHGKRQEERCSLEE